MPRLAIALVILALAVVAGISSYAGYLVLGVLADHLGTGRFLAGMLLGILFIRLPSLRQGKLRTIGILPKALRFPLTIGLLALAFANYFPLGEVLPLVGLGLAAALLLASRWIRQLVVGRVASVLSRSRPAGGPANTRRIDPTIIDADFTEKKD